MLSTTEFAENHSAKRKTDFDSAAREKNLIFLSLLPKAETCFPIIADACFMNQFTC